MDCNKVLSNCLDDVGMTLLGRDRWTAEGVTAIGQVVE